MIVARLDSYGATGWETQQALATSTPSTGEQTRRWEYNELILQPNSEMHKINAAVERALEAEAQPSS